MKLGNDLSAYSPQEVEAMKLQIQTWMETLRESDRTMSREVKNPTVASVDDNVIHIDLRPFTEYKRLEEAVLPLHEVLAIYDRWNDLLWEMSLLGIGFYKNTKVFQYLMALRLQVGTFQQFFNPQPSRPEPDSTPRYA